MVNFSAAKICHGLWERYVWAFLWHQNLQKFDKKLKKIRLGFFNVLKLHSHILLLFLKHSIIRPSGVTGVGGAEWPLTLLTGKFLLTYREQRGKEKGKMEKKIRKIKKRKVENWKWKGGKLQNEERTFLLLLLFLLLFFCFFVFFVFHFSKPLKFVLGLPKWEFSTGKKHFTIGKNQENWLCPLWKIFLLQISDTTDRHIAILNRCTCRPHSSAY